MAIIPLTSGFKLIPEGVHTFRIYDVKYDTDFGKLEIFMVNAQGITHKERFSLMNAQGEMNEKACGAFSFFAKTALNDFSLEEIDPAILVDHYIKGEITHTKLPSTNDPSNTITFANMGEKWVADGFDTTPVEKALSLGKSAPVEQKPKNEAPVDLGSLLN